MPLSHNIDMVIGMIRETKTKDLLPTEDQYDCQIGREGVGSVSLVAPPPFPSLESTENLKG